MEKSLEIKLGLEVKGLMRRRNFTVDRFSADGLGNSRNTYPTFAEAAQYVGTILINSWQDRQPFELSESDKFTAYFSNHSSDDEKTIQNLLRKTLVFYNKFVEEADRKG